MIPVKNTTKELYSEPEIQDITPVSVVQGDGDGSRGEEEYEEGPQ